MESLKGRFDTIFFDADDTLWENEQFFRNAEGDLTTVSVAKREINSNYTGSTKTAEDELLFKKHSFFALSCGCKSCGYSAKASAANCNVVFFYDLGFYIFFDEF